MAEKLRIDTFLVSLGLAESREKAKAYIMAGIVYVNNQKVDKAGDTVKPEDKIEVRGATLKYVSRGGLKLEKAMTGFNLALDGKICADIGASTGGFTDCMLQNGAKKVYAIDVGYGQLDWSLRTDDRVVVMERTNARYMEPAWYEQPLDFASIDVSFISLSKMLPPLHACLREGGEVVALIKPQFEAGRSEVGKNGVVRDARVHADVCRRVLAMAMEAGYHIKGLSYSPITGPKGNIEFLVWLEQHAKEEASTCAFQDVFVAEVVSEAHNACIK